MKGSPEHLTVEEELAYESHLAAAAFNLNEICELLGREAFHCVIQCGPQDQVCMTFIREMGACDGADGSDEGGAAAPNRAEPFLVKGSY